MSSITDQLDANYAPAWRPNPGETIVGRLVAIDERLGYNDEPYPILTVEQKDGTKLAAHCFHTVLKNEVGKQNPQLGETIAIKYLGQVEGGRGKYHSYRLAVDRKQPSVNLSKYADDDGDPGATAGASTPEPPDLPIDTGGLPAVPRDDEEDIPF